MQCVHAVCASTLFADHSDTRCLNRCIAPLLAPKDEPLGGWWDLLRQRGTADDEEPALSSSYLRTNHPSGRREGRREARREGRRDVSRGGEWLEAGGVCPCNVQ
jgi:hypothetical protein